MTSPFSLNSRVHIREQEMLLFKEIQSKSPYAVPIWENTDHTKKLNSGTFLAMNYIDIMPIDVVMLSSLFIIVIVSDTVFSIIIGKLN